MQIYVKRTKLFLHSQPVSSGIKDAAGNVVNIGKQLRFYAPKADVPYAAPDWIKDTLTFKVGLHDGSILDLTTPAAPELPEEIKIALSDKQAPKTVPTSLVDDSKGTTDVKADGNGKK